ncbi:hypothetical protein D9M72_572250 [compost metagenome]
MFDGDGKDYTEYASTGMRARIIATTIGSEFDKDAAWRESSSWVGNGVILVPKDYINKKPTGTQVDAVQLEIQPRCLVQKIATTSTPQLTGYLITARGFANNARFEDVTGKATQGAEAWLQSVLTRDK